jgi:hypothetical protein
VNNVGCVLCRYDAIRVGEPAEMLVLSRTSSFERFKVGKNMLLYPTTVKKLCGSEGAAFMHAIHGMRSFETAVVKIHLWCGFRH